mmetsp:Transcript_17545/g.15819  ORF Transcript_17545/g.15819 Transcript_17545/m.15819 type:complete len:105 (+) Transcript_17545:1207-1521(+)
MKKHKVKILFLQGALDIIGIDHIEDEDLISSNERELATSILEFSKSIEFKLSKFLQSRKCCGFTSKNKKRSNKSLLQYRSDFMNEWVTLCWRQKQQIVLIITKK